MREKGEKAGGKACLPLKLVRNKHSTSGRKSLARTAYHRRSRPRRNPFDLEGLRIVKQEVGADGLIRVAVIAQVSSSTCPRCHSRCRKIHDQRALPKRDQSLRGYGVILILWKRRFRCLVCSKPFTESDHAGGYRRRTTCRLREAIGQQAFTQPVSHVAKAFGVAQSFAQRCFEQEARKHLEHHGCRLEETQAMETPAYLGLDEFARRKGHRYDNEKPCRGLEKHE